MDAIMPRWETRYGPHVTALAAHIVQLTAAANHDIQKATDQGDWDEAEKRERRWRSDVLEACWESMEAQQETIKYLQNLLIERESLTAKPHVIQIPKPPPV